MTTVAEETIIHCRDDPRALGHRHTVIDSVCVCKGACTWSSVQNYWFLSAAVGTITGLWSHTPSCQTSSSDLAKSQDVLFIIILLFLKQYLCNKNAQKNFADKIKFADN